MNDWNIQSRAHACFHCEQPFVDKQAYHTALFEEAEGLRRQDVCAACWDGASQVRARSEAGFISHWQGVYVAPPPPDADPIQKDSAESLLRKLIDADDPTYIPAGYILAVMLERKRVLKVKEELKREGRRIFIYEHAKSADVFTIVDPELQLDQLEGVQREVALLMEQGLAPRSGQEDPTGGMPTADTVGVPEEECTTPSGTATA